MSEKWINPHGGDIYTASKTYGVKLQDIIDFSANINPLGIPGELRKTLISNINQLMNYPDPQCSSLKSGISGYLGVPQESIIIGNGACEVLFLLFDVLRPKNVMIVAPTFLEYAKAASQYEANVHYYELKEQNRFQLQMDDLIKQLLDNQVDVLVLCNPNNPTSTMVSKPDLLHLLQAACEKDIHVILDEAFIELTEGGNSNSMSGYLEQFPNLFIIRAFTKLFAIPGLRMGYGIGRPELIQRMWKKKIPWSVNSLVCGLGEYFCNAGDYLSKTNEWIIKEKEWFYNELKTIPHCKVYKPQTNFVLIRLMDTELTSAMLKEKLAIQGILIRDAANFVFLDNRYIRVAIKDRTNNTVLVSKLKEILQ